MKFFLCLFIVFIICIQKLISFVAFNCIEKIDTLNRCPKCHSTMKMQKVIARGKGMTPDILFKCKKCRRKKTAKTSTTWNLLGTQVEVPTATALLLLSVLLS